MSVNLIVCLCALELLGILLSSFVWLRYVDEDLKPHEPRYVLLTLAFNAIAWPVFLVVGLMTLAVNRRK